MNVGEVDQFSPVLKCLAQLLHFWFDAGHAVESFDRDAALVYFTRKIKNKIMKMLPTFLWIYKLPVVVFLLDLWWIKPFTDTKIVK
jgi:hypothetical protein